MQARAIISLIVTILLCLPSFAGAVVLLVNALLHRRTEEWGTVSSLTVAAAVFVGWPLVLAATLISGLVGLTQSVSQNTKYAHYIIVGLAALATFSLTFHFGMWFCVVLRYLCMTKMLAEA